MLKIVIDRKLNVVLLLFSIFKDKPPMGYFFNYINHAFFYILIPLVLFEIKFLGFHTSFRECTSRFVDRLNLQLRPAVSAKFLLPFDILDCWD